MAKFFLAGNVVNMVSCCLEGSIDILFPNEIDITSGGAIGGKYGQWMILGKIELSPALSNAQEGRDCTKTLILKSTYKGLLLTIVAILLESPGDV